jgi:hypothetical protein
VIDPDSEVITAAEVGAANTGDAAMASALPVDLPAPVIDTETPRPQSTALADQAAATTGRCRRRRWGRSCLPTPSRTTSPIRQPHRTPEPGVLAAWRNGASADRRSARVVRDARRMNASARGLVSCSLPAIPSGGRPQARSLPAHGQPLACPVARWCAVGMPDPPPRCARRALPVCGRRRASAPGDRPVPPCGVGQPIRKIFTISGVSAIVWGATAW